MPLGAGAVGAACAQAPSRVSKSRMPSAPVLCCRAATARCICTGASTTTCVAGKVPVSTVSMALRCACNAARSAPARTFRPSRLTAIRASRLQRAARQRGACSSVRAAPPRRLRLRLRWLLTRSSWAKSQSLWQAARARSARVCNCTLRPKSCSANAAMAGSARRAASCGHCSRATVLACSGQGMTPLALACNSRGWPALSMAYKLPAPAGELPCSASATAPGTSSGTMRATAMPAASSVCKLLRSQALSHTATQVLASLAAPGASAKCSVAGSSSSWSSSRPTSTARRRALLLDAPLGSCTWCHESCAAPTSSSVSVTRPVPALGSSASGALDAAPTARPSGLST